MAGFFGLAKRGLGLLGKKKPKPTTKPRPQTKHEKEQAFANLDPFVRGRILSARESAKKGDVFKGTSVMGRPSPHRSAESLKKHWGPGSYQLTDPKRKRRGPKAAGGRIGLQRGGGSAPFLRGRSGATNIKAPRGAAGWRQMQAAEAKIPSRGIVKGKANPSRMDQAQRLKAHRLRTKIAGAQASRAKQAQQEAGTARLYARHPGAKKLFAKQKFARQFRKAGIK